MRRTIRSFAAQMGFIMKEQSIILRGEIISFWVQISVQGIVLWYVLVDPKMILESSETLRIGLH